VLAVEDEYRFYPRMEGFHGLALEHWVSAEGSARLGKMQGRATRLKHPDPKVEAFMAKLRDIWHNLLTIYTDDTTTCSDFNVRRNANR